MVVNVSLTIWDINLILKDEQFLVTFDQLKLVLMYILL